jgi:asparagine synthase (glutamine-hydrolysing)
MCGIFGWIGVVPDELKNQTESIKYRGPDDDHFIESNQAFLAHAALKIQNKNASIKQPYTHNNSTIYSAFNGEIFNWLHRKSKINIAESINTDIEIVYHDYIIHGTEAMQYWTGFFAGCFLNIEDVTCVLFRDSFGIKPLFYRLFPEGLAFASVASALSLSTDQWNVQSCIELATCQMTGQETWLKGKIYIFPPGKILTWEKNKIHWKDIKINVEEKPLINQLEMVLQEQVISSVPSAWLLSGGLDSSLLAAVGQQFKNLPAYSLNTGSLGRLETDFKYAQLLAKKLQLELIEVKPYEVNLKKLIAQWEFPFADPGALALHWVAETAHKNGVRVLISGMGADEFFGGYKRHIWSAGYHKWLLKCLILGRSIMSQNQKERLELLAFPHWGWWLKVIPSNFLEEFGWNQSMIIQPFPGENLKQIDQKGYLIHNGLFYSDEIGMRNQMEIRVPYLDQRITQHQDTKLPNKNGLRNMAKRWIPEEIIHRPKTGFGCMEEQLIKLHCSQIVELVNEMKSFGFPMKYTQKLLEQKNRTEIESRFLWTAVIWGIKLMEPGNYPAK